MKEKHTMGGCIMKKMQIDNLVLSICATNCYLVKNKENGALLIIDPADAPDRIIQKIEQMDAKPEAILLTHGHFDHIGAAMKLHEHYGIPVYAHRAEQEILENVDKNLSLMIGMGFTATADNYLNDGQQLELAGFDIRIIHTPGHTIGSSCYYFETEGVLFSGDTLFRCSVGRTDFPTGSMRQIHDSIHEKLFVLPEETMVYPGHDQVTDIRYEKMFNPY